MLRGLLERQLLRIAGHREVPGRPIVYATTRRFLEVFGLTKLGDLPALRDLAELNDLEGGDVGVTGRDGEADESVDGADEPTRSEEETLSPLVAPPPPTS